MKIDWYQANIPENHDTIISVLESHACDVSTDNFTKVEMVKGLHRYPFGAEITFIRDFQHQQFARLCWDPAEPNLTYVQSSSSIADDVATIIRANWPVHKVSRVDVCQDWSGGSDTFDLIRNHGLEVATNFRVKTRDISSPTDKDAGRTFYMGSPTSAVMGRLYEKGLHPDSILFDIPSDIIRWEVQIRPSSKMKTTASTLSPSELVASSAWSMEMANRLQLYPGEKWNPNGIYTRGSKDRTIDALFRQYGPCIRDQMAEMSPDELYVWCGEMLLRRAKLLTKR